MSLTLVIDEQIPLPDWVLRHADYRLVKKPGAQINQADLINADVLLVRTVTRVDGSLLSGTSIRWVGTATAGFDHLDTNYLKTANIAWAYAPGCNAVAVAEYVLCCIAALKQQQCLPKRPLRVGVIGVGHVGSQVAALLNQIGCDVLLNDPPRAAADKHFQSTPLEDFRALDLICIHASLTKKGPFPSFHLLNAHFLQQQKPGCALLNAARGGIIDTAVLCKQSHLQLCLDVWENEPNISLALLDRATIATPHIAGYSVRAKQQASEFIFRQMNDFFDIPSNTAAHLDNPDFNPNIDWENQALSIYNPLTHTAQLKQSLDFATCRQTYPWRDSFIDASAK